MATLLPAAEITPVPRSTRAQLPQDQVSREALERKLKMSMKGINDTREAPWYGPWGIALELLFMTLPLPQYANCVTVPQLPVIRKYDPAVLDDAAAAMERATVADEANSAPATGPPVPGSPLTEHLTRLPDTILPLPPQWSADDAYPDKNSSRSHWVYDTQPSTPITTGPFLTQPPNTDEISYSPEISALFPSGAIRSTRVPDFSTLVQVFDNFLKHMLRSFLVLIVEIKAPVLGDLDHTIYQTRVQVLEQAQHAFGADPQLQVLGCIIAVGEAWTYFDIKRENIPASPKLDLGRTRSATTAKGKGKEPSKPPQTLSKVDIDMPALFLIPTFGREEEYLKLTEHFERSMIAFELILKHLTDRIGQI